MLLGKMETGSTGARNACALQIQFEFFSYFSSIFYQVNKGNLLKRPLQMTNHNLIAIQHMFSPHALQHQDPKLLCLHQQEKWLALTSRLVPSYLISCGRLSWQMVLLVLLVAAVSQTALCLLPFQGFLVGPTGNTVVPIISCTYAAEQSHFLTSGFIC